MAKLILCTPRKNAYNRAVMDGCAMKPALWQQSLNMSKDLISMHKHQRNGIIPVPLFLHHRETEFTDRLPLNSIKSHLRKLSGDIF